MVAYSLTEETRVVRDKTLYRILAADGRQGGFVESRQNLAQEGSCFLHGDSIAMDASKVEGDAQVFGLVRDRAAISGNAEIYGEVYGNAKVQGYAKVYGRLGGDAVVGGHTIIYGDG